MGQTITEKKYFYGNEISDYGLEHGYVDYASFAKAFDGVLNNDIFRIGWDIGFGWEQESGFVDNSDQIDKLREEIEELSEPLSELNDEWYELPEPDTDEETSKRYAVINAEMERLENEIKEKESMIEDLEYEQEYEPEVFQWYIVSDRGAELLKGQDEIVYYNEELGMYIWGVTHFGTSWRYVLTDIMIDW